MENLSWQIPLAALLDSVSKCREMGPSEFLRAFENNEKTQLHPEYSLCISTDWSIRRRWGKPARLPWKAEEEQWVFMTCFVMMRIDFITLLPFNFLCEDQMQLKFATNDLPLSLFCYKFLYFPLRMNSLIFRLSKTILFFLHLVVCIL